MSYGGYVLQYQRELTEFYLRKIREAQARGDKEAQEWVDEYNAVRREWNDA